MKFFETLNLHLQEKVNHKKLEKIVDDVNLFTELLCFHSKIKRDNEYFGWDETAELLNWTDKNENWNYDYEGDWRWNEVVDMLSDLLVVAVSVVVLDTLLVVTSLR